MAERKIIVGKIYKHLNGQIYRVNGIATHPETGERMVIYQAQSGDMSLYVLPCTVFNQEVNKAKHPNAKQTYVFEPMPGGGSRSNRSR